MRITQAGVRRLVHAGAIVTVLASVGTLAGCARKAEPGDPLDGLTRAESARFDRGKQVFEREFAPETGLGPLFNSTSCRECHEDPATGGSGDEVEVHATAFHPQGAGGRGDGCSQLVEEGGFVVQQHVTPALHDALGIDAEPVPAHATATGRRTTPSILGFGLLDAVRDETILAHADPEDRDHDGISGRPNRFTDGRIGRFGRKAFVPTLREFTAGAFLIEQGITSPAQPVEGSIGGRPIPPGVDPSPDPELSRDDLDLATDFVRFLAPPVRGAAGLGVIRGAWLFRATGCAACHVPELETGKDDVRALRHREVNAYTDLLLHDMGPDLADICLGLAAPSEFRTEPLMGLRLRKHFLHDGRTDSIEKAIGLHGGEATASRGRFEALSAEERQALLRFLASL
jgi:CxxC motif-containing protein (DUF1111 family)